MAKNISVYGIYKTKMGVENAITEFKTAGFRNSDISALFPTGTSNKEFAHVNSTKSAEGAAAGATSGIVLGGVLGWLAGIGSLAIPGVGPLIAAGPIVAMLAGAGVGGAVGSISGGLIGLGLPEYEAKRYEGQVKSGGVLLSVHCDDTTWSSRAKEIMERTGAESISSSSEEEADTNESDRPYPVSGPRV